MPFPRELVWIRCSLASADLPGHGGSVPERDDVPARGTVSQCPVRCPAQGGGLLDQLCCQSASVLLYRRQPDPGQQLDGREQPDGSAVGHGRQLESPGAGGQGEFLRPEVERGGTAFPSDHRGDGGRKVFGYGKQRDAARGRRPLIPAAHQRVCAPFGHGDRDRAGHLCDVNHDPGANPSASATRSATSIRLPVAY